MKKQNSPVSHFKLLEGKANFTRKTYDVAGNPNPWCSTDFVWNQSNHSNHNLPTLGLWHSPNFTKWFPFCHRATLSLPFFYGIFPNINQPASDKGVPPWKAPWKPPRPASLRGWPQRLTRPMAWSSKAMDCSEPSALMGCTKILGAGRWWMNVQCTGPGKGAFLRKWWSAWSVCDIILYYIYILYVYLIYVYIYNYTYIYICI